MSTTRYGNSCRLRASWHDRCVSHRAGTGRKPRKDNKISESPGEPSKRLSQGTEQGVRRTPDWSCRSELVSQSKKLNTPGQRRRRGRARSHPGLPHLPWTREGGSTAVEGDLEGQLPRTCPSLLIVPSKLQMARSVLSPGACPTRRPPRRPRSVPTPPATFIGRTGSYGTMSAPVSSSEKTSPAGSNVGDATPAVDISALRPSEPTTG